LNAGEGLKESFLDRQGDLVSRNWRVEIFARALKQIEGGVKGLETCRELGISEATLYNWKKRDAGMV
jgi:hypothetical protein